MDVGRYLQRIGATGPLSANIGSLATLMRQHLLTVPFENLDIHRHVAIELDLERIFAKIVTARRGGFCYELNGVFAALLEAIGFRVTKTSCRVFGNDEAPCRPFDHLALAVEVGSDSYLVDVGFGEGLRRPLRLAAGETERELGFVRTIERHGAELKLVQRSPVGQRDGYLIDPTPRALGEFARMCRYHQTSPESPFTRKPLCTLATVDGRVTLSDDTLTTTAGQIRRARALGSADHRMRALREVFGIELEGTL